MPIRELEGNVTIVVSLPIIIVVFSIVEPLHFHKTISPPAKSDLALNSIINTAMVSGGKHTLERGYIPIVVPLTVLFWKRNMSYSSA
jgi:hypothetical protein